LALPGPWPGNYTKLNLHAPRHGTAAGRHGGAARGNKFLAELNRLNNHAPQGRYGGGTAWRGGA